ncbi:MAG TPA: SpoIID/LytB domain-containing protein [bacterium]|nr:SpoIID/LytB domain-containing protein [bacterium]HOL35753.1 SpoIID/LytB domain-containing protein [bacterium]HPP07838.1 SpoIID/LytB domain-containing protein [bacterium]
MFRFVSKKALVVVSIFVLLNLALSRAETVRICVWEGSQKPPLESFRGKYRGQLSLVKWNKKYLVINTMDVEEYLFGVVGKEMEKSWPFEALKAQAVCSRTLIYYYKDLAMKKNMPYDVSDTIYHQVYGGITSEDEAIVRAVEETYNQVLIGKKDNKGYNILPTFFHACCGGHTASAENTWGGKYFLLNGVEDPYCEGTPFYWWSKTFTRNEISSIVGTDVNAVDAIGFDSSGRVRRIEFSGKTGKKVMSAENFRMLTINNNTTFKSAKTLPSTMFTVSKKGDYFVFSGKGYGHGVGMCQWGARRMAEEGKNYAEILSHYFPNLVLVSFSEIPANSNVGTEEP